MSNRPMLTIPQVMTRLALSRSTVYALIRAGELRASKFGNTFRIDERDLEQCIRGRRTHVDEPAPAAAAVAAVDADREFDPVPDVFGVGMGS